MKIHDKPYSHILESIHLETHHSTYVNQLSIFNVWQQHYGALPRYICATPVRSHEENAGIRLCLGVEPAWAISIDNNRISLQLDAHA